MLLFFSVARSAHTSQADRATQAHSTTAATIATNAINGNDIQHIDGEKMPVDMLLDVSPLALRMSSPFNSEYWLTAA